MGISNSAPSNDEAEISLFGPGVGECIVIHYGQGKWFIVDSCLCPETNEPIALKYLNSINVNVSNQVEGVLITHWHQDHIKGAAEIMKQCTNAKLFLSAALMESEAVNLALLYNKAKIFQVDKEISEFSEIIQFLKNSKALLRIETVKANHSFFNLNQNGVAPTKLLALSPSSSAVNQSIANIVDMMPNPDGKRGRNLIKASENLNAVAMYFSYADFSAVLGSDLEEGQNKNSGWSAVISSNIFDNQSLALADLFKVPHHGSENAHNDDVWTQLLKASPLSITTPFLSSRLPTDQDIQRIKSLSSDFHITHDPKSSTKIRRDNMVEREMKSIVLDRKVLNKIMGHIQIRITPDAQTTINLNEAVVTS